MYEIGVVVAAYFQKLAKLLDRWGGNTRVERSAFLIFLGGTIYCLLWVLFVDRPIDRAVDTLFATLEFGSWEARQHPAIAWTMRITVAALAWRMMSRRVMSFVAKPDALPPDSTAAQVALHFTSPSDALDYACRFLKSGRNEGEIIVGVITKITDDIMTVEAASENGPVTAIARANSGPIEYPDQCVGQLCALLVGPYVKEAELYAMLGIAILEPSYESNGWKVRRRI